MLAKGPLVTCRCLKLHSLRSLSSDDHRRGQIDQRESATARRLKVAVGTAGATLVSGRARKAFGRSLTLVSDLES